MIQDETLHLGIDLGGTKIEIAAINENGQCALRRRIDTPKVIDVTTNYHAILQAIATLVYDSEHQLQRSGLSLGVGIPGSIEAQTGLIKNANTQCLINQPLKQDLEKKLSRPIVIENDANCFAYSEAYLGIGKTKHYKSIFAVILGTGVGGAWVVNNTLITGANGIAGEWGHNPLPWQESNDLPAELCYCGKYGCIETYLSGPGCASMAHKQYNLEPNSHFIFEQKDQDVNAERAYSDYCRRLAKSLAHIVNIMDPDCIVLGGGISNIQSLYEDIPALWQDYIFNAGENCAIKTKLLPNQLGDSSGVFGAALLGMDQATA